MTDASELKDADKGPHESWCDTQNAISQRCNCMASSYIDQIEDHNRILAERDQLWKRATKFVMPGDFDTGESIEHYIKMLEQTIARQARVIEKLRISMATALELESCGETSCPIPMRAMCSTPSHKELRKTLLEITAIEQGEGT